MLLKWAEKVKQDDLPEGVFNTPSGRSSDLIVMTYDQNYK